MQRAVAALGGVDILVNRAAPVQWLAASPRLADPTADAFQKALNVKVLGYPALLAAGGSVDAPARLGTHHQHCRAGGGRRRSACRQPTWSAN